MAHFYGTVRGQARTEGTRCGSKGSGATTYCASWAGAISCWAYYDEALGMDVVLVEMCLWHGHGERKVLYSGPIGHYLPEREQVEAFVAERRAQIAVQEAEARQDEQVHLLTEAGA